MTKEQLANKLAKSMKITTTARRTNQTRKRNQNTRRKLQPVSAIPFYGVTELSQKAFSKLQ